MKRTMQRTAYNISIPDSLALREQGITRLTCLRLYREFADECRWLVRVAQTEITRLTCIGCSNKQIAERLSLKVEAVQVHLNGIFCKVGVKSRTELAAVLVKRL